ncbi:hypothetical protein [Aliiroseovarius crassostreae]|uniref:hypothetical protein n=1 Tax=Aliiroseovarius crassostreae TaxID=154981 RepID=UPI003C7A456B
MKQKTFRFADRAKQKTLSRARDEARLKSGEVTPSELRKENAFIKGSGFAKKIGFLAHRSCCCLAARKESHFPQQDDQAARQLVP